MPNMIICDGEITQPAMATGRAVQGVASCSEDWLIVPYVEPTDSTAIYAQLVALNEFDPERAAWIVIICLSTFLAGFGVGVVIKLLRRL